MLRLFHHYEMQVEKDHHAFCAAPISQEALVTNFENHQIVYVTYLYLSEAFGSI